MLANSGDGRRGLQQALGGHFDQSPLNIALEGLDHEAPATGLLEYMLGPVAGELPVLRGPLLEPILGGPRKAMGAHCRGPRSAVLSALISLGCTVPWRPMASRPAFTRRLSAWSWASVK